MAAPSNAPTATEPARATVPIIEQHIQSSSIQLNSQLFSGSARSEKSPTFVTVTTTVNGAIVDGNQKPLASFDCSMAAVRMRSIPMP